MAIRSVIRVGVPGVLCVAVTGCGGSSHHQGRVGPYGPASSPVALSKCMRANGLSNFPDPSAGPGGGVGFNGLFVEGDGGLVVDGITFKGPALARAKEGCSVYLPPSGPPPQPSAAQKAQAVTFARCMRANGVPNFPDPIFNGGAAQKALAINPNSPAVRHAVQACGGGAKAISAP